MIASAVVAFPSIASCLGPDQKSWDIFKEIKESFTWHLEFADGAMCNFARCVLENKQSRVAGEEGLRDMLIIDAVHESI